MTNYLPYEYHYNLPKPFSFQNKLCFQLKHKHTTRMKKKLEHLQRTSKTRTLLLGGVRLVLLDTQVNREFRCCLPMAGNNKWFIVLPSGLCSKDSSITVLSKYHVTFGRGRPEKAQYKQILQ